MSIHNNSVKIWSLAIAGSLFAHLASFGTAINFAPTVLNQEKTVVKLTIKEPPKPVEQKNEEPKPPPPKLPEKKKPPEKKLTERVKPTEPNQPQVQPKPIMGLDPSAISPDGKGIAAPVGNTLMIPDDGKRVKPEDVKAFTGDLTSDARLIRDSLKKVEYTDGAVEAALEGRFTVDVYVDEKGNVTSAELRKKIGHGMDDRVLEVARSAKFTPRRNKLGVAEAAWSEILFVLQLP